MNISLSLRALLENLIDYAGLFPPSTLDMQSAVRNYSEYLNSEKAWMLARFIVPVAKLDAFQNEFNKLEKSNLVWRISALSSSDAFKQDLQAAIKFNQLNESRAVIDAFELKVDDKDEMALVMSDLEKHRGARDFFVFFELAINDNLAELVESVDEAYAKIRTGGITPAQVPPSANVLNFIRVCQQHNASFKATAGLHHPVRAEQNLTYEQDAPRAVMHGFINVFLAAAFIFDGMNDTDALSLIDETDATSFAFTDESVAWREHEITLEKFQIARLDFALSFGSCSFTEPVEDLRALGFLPN